MSRIERLVEEVRFNRRLFLAGGIAALGAASLTPYRAWALASAAPKYAVGDFELTVVSDGELSLPLSIFGPDATPEELAEIAKRLGWTPPNASPATNHAVLKKGEDIILIDTGSGTKMQPSAGKLVENLKAAGIDPAAITKVIITHAHPDHVWGTTTTDGALIYPNASYHVGEAEWNFWMDPDLAGKMPAAMTDIVKGAQRELTAIKDKAAMIKPGADVVTGIRAIDTSGHTPGHLSFEVAGGEGLIITGDATTNQIVAFEHPDWKFGFDAVPDLAIKNRKALLDRAATDKVRLIGYHWTAPGVGFAEKNGTAYRFAAG
jgi:glyoxylase-like metal-dependent hydrolase (beta-lactamase superfamily II)